MDNIPIKSAMCKQILLVNFLPIKKPINTPVKFPNGMTPLTILNTLVFSDASVIFL